MHAKLDNSALPGENNDNHNARVSRHVIRIAMAAEGLGFECVGEGSLTSEYIVTAPIEQIRETVAKAAAESIEVAIPDDAKA
jgi:hypothetical protein